MVALSSLFGLVAKSFLDAWVDFRFHLSENKKWKSKILGWLKYSALLAVFVNAVDFCDDSVFLLSTPAGPCLLKESFLHLIIHGPMGPLGGNFSQSNLFYQENKHKKCVFSMNKDWQTQLPIFDHTVWKIQKSTLTNFSQKLREINASFIYNVTCFHEIFFKWEWISRLFCSWNIHHEIQKDVEISVKSNCLWNKKKRCPKQLICQAYYFEKSICNYTLGFVYLDTPRVFSTKTQHFTPMFLKSVIENTPFS